jgi:diketogulonate reductase-like aldo/keto reductase
MNVFKRKDFGEYLRSIGNNKTNKMINIVLNNGVEMPQIGLGTFLIPKDQLSRTIAEAYDIGYRNFDTAWRYDNEAAIVKALKEHGVNRNDVFITTKINIDALYFKPYMEGLHRFLNVRRRTIRQAIKQSFKNLGTDYIDLFLVHYPWYNYAEMYEALAEFYGQGRIRAIGVCSCLQPHIEYLKEFSDITPAVNQFEISPLNTQKSLIKYCQDNNIAVQAMSVFSHFRSNEVRKEIVDNEVLQSIASRKNKSVVQIVLRWLLQQGIAIIPKTWRTEYLVENYSIQDFTLSEDDMQLIDTLDGGKFLNYNPYVALKNVPQKYR